MEFWNLSRVSDNSGGSYEVQTSRFLSPVSQGKGYLVASLIYRTKASGPAKVHSVYAYVMGQYPGEYCSA